ITLRIPVTVRWPVVSRIEIRARPGRLYAGTTLGHSVAAFHADGSERPRPQVRWASSEPAVATVDAFGNVTGVAPGRARITASLDQASAAADYTVAPFPGASIDITGATDGLRTGDVVAFTAVVRDANGRPLPDVPVAWAHSYQPTEQAQL